MAEADLGVKRGCFADFASYGRGLRLFWDPRGRSPRTELGMLVAVPLTIYLLLVLPFGGLLPLEWFDSLRFAVVALIAVPLPAAASRRFHDMAKSGWLALPVMVLAGIGLWDAWLDVTAGPYASADLINRQPQLAYLYGASCLLFAVLLMQPPRHAANPHGPDPRPRQKVI